MGYLRCLLAISVLIGHTGPIFGIELIGAVSAVQSFFIISGFYMSLILTEKYTGPGSYKLFITNRLLRLWPTYAAVLLLTLIASFFSYLIFGNWGGKFKPYFEFSDALNMIEIGYLFFSNLFLLGQDVTLFLGLDLDGGGFFLTGRFLSTFPRVCDFLLVPAGWTISLELIFYLLAPILIRQSSLSITLIIASSFLLRLYIYYGLEMYFDPWTYRFLPTEMGLFLLGLISHRIYCFVKMKRKIETKLQWPFIILFTSITLLYQFLPNTDLTRWFYYFLVVLCVPFLFHIDHKLKYNKLIGDLTYPVYLVHYLVIISVLPLLEKIQKEAYLGVLTLFLSFAISLGIMKLVIDPIEIFRQRRVRERQVQNVL
jgi:peptidoglycan/LPS O-acetylase OafA/YrhL